MNARKSSNRKVTNGTLIGGLLAVLSFNALADSTAVLDTRAPVHATLLPAIKVSASISNPLAAVRWSIAPGRPIPVTLMPTLTVTADALNITNLPTVSVVAPAGFLSGANAQALVLTTSFAPPVLDWTN